jgi:MFS family permease
MSGETTTTLYCATHPARETLLRCNRCENPICYQCAVLTEVGYRCKDCVAGQRAKYYNAGRLDLWLGAGIAVALGAVLGALAYAFLGLFGWFSFLGAIFVGPAAGGAIAEAIRRALRRRRARGMKLAAAIGCVIGVLLGGWLLFFMPGLLAGASVGPALAFAPRLLFRLDVLLLTGLAASTLYARLL